ALSFKFLFFSNHCWSWMISSGYVDAARTCASIGSGYSAIGATKASNCSAGILAAAGLAAAVSACLGCAYNVASPGSMTRLQRSASWRRNGVESGDLCSMVRPFLNNGLPTPIYSRGTSREPVNSDSTNHKSRDLQFSSDLDLN